MVIASHDPQVAKVWQILETVMDPEIPVLSIVDLGIVRDVRAGCGPAGIDGDGIEVTLTPTYTGCPATKVILDDTKSALDQAGLHQISIQTILAPAWSTSWISEAGRHKLKKFGIAPPDPNHDEPLCPRCGSAQTECLSRFGSTPCKSIHRCCDCLEPFDHFKCH